MWRLSTCLILLLTLNLTGCSKPPQEEAQAKPQQEENLVGVAALAGEKDKKGIIGKKTQTVHNFKELKKQQPDLEEIKKDLENTNYIKQTMDIYKKTGSEASRLGMQQMVEVHKAQYDKYPTYDEFMEYLTSSGSSFTMLPAKEAYAYDEDTGRIMIVPRPAE
ncbi:MAG: hypothetical protein R3C11_19505 [Planctomycetaceae bacterium]